MLKYPIHCDQDLRIAHYILHTLEAHASRVGMDIDTELISLKREIRRYQKSPLRPLHVIQDDGDGYISLEKLPNCWDETATLGEVKEYFESHCCYALRPSIYDCTGRPFTVWFKPVFRHGNWFVYHRVCYDV